MNQWRGTPAEPVIIDLCDDSDDVQCAGPSTSKLASTSRAPNIDGVSTFNPRSTINIQKQRQGSTVGTHSRVATPAITNAKRRARTGDDDIEVVGGPVPSTSTNSKRKRKSPAAVKHEAIEISEDDSEEIQEVKGRDRKKLKREYRLREEAKRLSSRNTSTETLRTPPTAPARPPPIPPNRVSDEDEVDHIDIHDERFWEQPEPKEPKRLEPTTPPEPWSEQGRDVSLPQRRRVAHIPQFPSSFGPVSIPGGFVWDQLASTTRTGPKRSWQLSDSAVLGEAFGLGGLKQTDCFKEASGAIICLVQRQGWVVAGGANSGGGVDVENEVVNAYNRPGSLITYKYSKPENKRVRKQEGHQMERNDRTKHYGINDVKFFPHEADTRFISSSYDCHVRICDRPRVDGDYINSITLTRKRFNGPTLELAFHRDASRSVLAVGEREIYFFNKIERHGHSKPAFVVPISPANATLQHNVGAICWGTGSSLDLLCASSELTVEGEGVNMVGYHKAVDVTAQKVVVEFDAKEAGDSMALDPAGNLIMLTTRGDNRSNLLRLYDLRTKNPKALYKMDLDPYPSSIEEPEVHDASFSPDGIYFAVGRHDNETHVYDSRFLGDGPALKFRHSPEYKNAPDNRPCGVMKLEWVSGSPWSPSRLGLITGGSDGCVRLWDPLRAGDEYDNGTVLVEAKSDISTFSLGDRFKGEHQLIVGDGSGEITIFDRAYTDRDLD